MEFFKQRGPLFNHFIATLVCISIISSSPVHKLRVTLEPLGLWFDVWIFVFGFSAFIIARMAYDLLLLNGFNEAWQYLYGPVSKETRDDLRRMILFENSDYPVSKGFANGALIVMMLAVAAAFVWFTFLA